MSDSQQNLIIGLRSRLTGDSDFNTSLGGDSGSEGRVYDTWPPDADDNADDPFKSAQKPFALITIVDDPNVLTFVDDSVDATVDVDLFCDRDSGAAVLRGIGGDLYDRLHNASLTISGYSNASAQCRSRGQVIVEGDILHLTQTYNIKAS